MIKAVKYFLFLAALTPIITTWSTIFPFILGKTLFFRSIVEIALILFLIYFIRQLYLKSDAEFFLNLKKIFKHPLVISLSVFFLFLALSVVFAENSYRAFWGDLERGEGFLGLLHAFVFLILTLAVFEKKDWLNFFKISLVVGFVAIFYAFLQYFGVKSFPLALEPSLRPISYIGNAAFLATHMFFVMMFAVAIFFNQKNNPITANSKINNLITRFWRYFSPLMAVLAVITIFLTAVRGAILGLAAGIFLLLIYFIFQSANRRIRKVSAGILGLLIIFSGVFWSTRKADLWQSVPGLNRLANTAFFDVNDPSTQTRLITWRLSWEAFKERPLFGWGPENYLVAYEKHYDPEFAVYGETWLDRAHNKIIDISVTQGIFGLVAYLAIFWFALRSLFKERKNEVLILMTGLAAYFFQNLFIFDQVVSNAAFFAVLGYVVFITPSQKEEKQAVIIDTFKKPMALAAGVAILVLLYSLYFYNLVPYIQARLFKASPGVSENIDVVVDYLKKAMYPYNFAQYNIRGTGVDTIYMGQFFYRQGYANNPRFKPLGNLLIDAMDEVARREPYDIRVLIREVEMLNGVSRVTDEKDAIPLFEKAEKLMREAVKRAPNRQEVYYHLAFNLAGQGRYQEAIDTAKYAISLNTRVARAYYHLALMSTLAGKNNEALAALAEIDRYDPDLSTLLGDDRGATLLIYNINGRNDKVAEFVIASLNRGEIGAFERKYYEDVLRYLAFKNEAKNFIKVASYLMTQFSDLKDDMEILIDLAQKGQWSIIENL